MRKRWIASLAVSLGLLATTVRAGEDPWRQPPAKPTTAVPAAQIGRPIAIDDATPPPFPPVVDSQVRPTAYQNVPTSSGSTMQPQGTDSNVARPMPLGNPLPSGSQTTWKRADDTTPAPLPSGPASSIGKPISTDPEPLPAPREVTPNANPTIWDRLTHPFSDCGPDHHADCGCGPDLCGVGCCENGCCYNPGNRFYVSAEGLIWWMKGNRVPPLVTTGSAADAVPGALGQPGTTVLFGGNSLGTGADGGGRFMAGFWLTRDHALGFEGGYWFLNSRSNTFSATSLGVLGQPLLFRPFTDETGTPNVELVAVPSAMGNPALGGTVLINSKTSLWGTEGNFRSTLWCGPSWYIDGLIGFRAMGLDDDLSIHESLQAFHDLPATNSPPVLSTIPNGTTFVVDDRFRTTNRFYGGQVGLDMEYRRANWIFGFKSKLALGTTNELVTISGGTSINGAPPLTGGLLAQTSNIGSHSRNVFSVVPEETLSVGYQFNDHWRVFVAYNVLYWSSVARSGAQIDTNVNRNLIPPPVGTGTTPAFNFHSTDFWAQGVNFGVEFKW